MQLKIQTATFLIKMNHALRLLQATQVMMMSLMNKMCEEDGIKHLKWLSTLEDLETNRRPQDHIIVRKTPQTGANCLHLIHNIGKLQQLLWFPLASCRHQPAIVSILGHLEVQVVVSLQRVQVDSMAFQLSHCHRFPLYHHQLVASWPLRLRDMLVHRQSQPEPVGT
jgi:hypothetical protein